MLGEVMDRSFVYRDSAEAGLRMRIPLFSKD